MVNINMATLIPTNKYQLRGPIFIFSYFQVCSRIPLLSMDETGEKERIPDEENRSVVANKVPVTLVSVKLDCKSSKIKIKSSFYILH